MTVENQLFKYWKVLSIICGSWTGGFPGKSVLLHYLYNCYAIINQVIFFMVIPNFGTKLYEFIQTNKLSQAMELIPKMIFLALVQVKFVLNQSKGIRNLLKWAIAEESKIYARPEVAVKKIYDGYVKYCKKVVGGLTYLTCIAGGTFIIFNLYEMHEYFRTVPPELRNITSKPLPAPMWYPYNPNKHYAWSILQQWFNTLQTAMYNSLIQALIHTAMIFIKAEFKILAHDLRNVGINSIKNQKQNGSYKDHNLIVLKSLIRKHQQLIRWVNDFNNSIKYLLLLEYSLTSMMLASTLIQVLLKEKVFFNVSFLILCIVQIFILGWNANEITLASSTELCDSIYKCKWYEQSKDAKIIVRLMMTRCQCPLTLSIGPFGDMNLYASISTIKLAYSYLSVFM